MTTTTPTTTPTTPQIYKGLAGVYADTTQISKVFEDTNTLTYRGYPVQQLAEHCRFEEVAYLLWYGELPTAEQLAAFEKQERASRNLSENTLKSIELFPKKAHPMATLRTAISYIGVENSFELNGAKPGQIIECAISLMAKIPTIIAATARLSNGLDVIAPRADLTMSENFFNMYFGEVPEQKIIKCFDTSLIFYAEHGFNASTFAARSISSTLTDVYSAICGAIGSLRGPLHGGANEAVMHTLLEIGSPEKAQAWIDNVLSSEKKQLVMGFGHRVYKQGDSRVPYMNKVFRELAEIKNDKKWVEIEDILAKTMLERKNIHPNVDFPVGPAYYLMGFSIPTYTPIFVMSRITGWIAHIIEQMENNKIIRPLSVYNGLIQRDVVPIDKRKAAA